MSPDTRRSPKAMPTDVLFGEFIGLCNLALSQPRDSSSRFILLEAVAQLAAGGGLAIAVYEANPDVTYDSFMVVLVDRKLRVVSRGVGGGPEAWKIRRTFLEAVVDHPEHFFGTPSPPAERPYLED